MINSIKSSWLTPQFIRLVGGVLVPHEAEDAHLCIITYHRILDEPDPILESEPDKKTFHAQMMLLTKCFNVLPLGTAMTALANGRLPPRAVCITFDDGYRSTHDLALPILKELNLPATVFVMTGHMEKGNMWNDEIIEVLRHLPECEVDLREFGLTTYQLGKAYERKDVIHLIIEKTKYLPSKTRAEVVEKLIRLGGNLRAPNLMLTREMVVNLARNGIEIGAHTINHPILTRMEDEQARYEIVGCKKQLEEITGKPVQFFAYPNGKIGLDFDERHVQMVQEAGYIGAFTTAHGAATREQNVYKVPRSRPWDRTTFFYGLRLLRWLRGETV